MCVAGNRRACIAGNRRARVADYRQGVVARRDVSKNTKDVSLSDATRGRHLVKHSSVDASQKI